MFFFKNYPMTLNSLEGSSVDDCDLTYMTCYRKYHNGAARASEASRAATARNGKKRKIKLKKRNKIFDTMYPSMVTMVENRIYAPTSKSAGSSATN